MPMNEVLSRFQGVTRGADGQYSAKCPAHDDQKASLSISTGKDGRILFNCHAGCEVEAVAAAAGLEMKDLFPESGESRTPAPKPRIVATYKYTDLDGKQCEKIRRSDKSYGWRQPDGRGGVVYNRKGIGPLLYNREAVDTGAIVFIVEGEKDVETMKSYGLPAVCSADGAGPGKWPAALNSLFTGKQVYILNDNDGPGRDFAREIADNLHGTAASVKLLEVLELDPDLPEHGDISDVFQRAQDKEAAKLALGRLAKGAAAYAPRVNPSEVLKREAEKSKLLAPVNASDLMGKAFPALMQPVVNLICEGLTMLVGASKIGKSWLVLQLALHVAGGAVFWGRETTKCRVLYLALEDSLRRLQTRLRTLDMDVPENLQLLTSIDVLGEGFEEQIEEWLSREAGPKMIIVDTFQKIRGASSGKDNAYQADYKVMGVLKAIADRHRAAIVCVHHTNKLRKVEDPFEKVSGSMAIMGAADTTILITRERGADVATVSLTGRDVWGDDFVIRFENGRWAVEHENAFEYHASNEYEAQPLVQVLRKLAAENPGGGKWAYTELEAIGLDLLGYRPFTSTRECTSKVGDLSAELLRRDGILVTCGVTVNKKTEKYTIHGKGVQLEVRAPETSFQSKIEGV